jgi:polysaccharide biosynthesis protein PslG
MRLRNCLAVVLASTALVGGIQHGASAQSEADPAGADPAVTTAASSPQLRTDVPVFGAQYMGVWGNRTDDNRRQLLDKLADTGVRWVRIPVPWAMLQPNRPTTDDDGWNTAWALPRVDSVIDMAHERGLKITATLLQTPSWANGGQGPWVPPTDLADYARAAEFLARRYRDKVESWEIWNEPNHVKFGGGMTAADYTGLLCAAYPAVKAADPDAPVVFGGTAGNDWEFIGGAYASGAKPCFDVLAVHPYNADYSPYMTPRSTDRWWFQNVPLVRQVMLEHEDAATPLWFTEVGWSTHDNTPDMPTNMRGVTLEQQARYLVDMLDITKERYPYVERVSWFSSRDEENGDIENDNFGLFTVELDPKPSALALRDYLVVPAGTPDAPSPEDDPPPTPGTEPDTTVPQPDDTDTGTGTEPDTTDATAVTRTVERRLRDPRLSRTAGLAVGHRHRGVVYAVPGGRARPRLFAVGRRGDTRAVLRLRGVPATQLAGVSAGPRGALWLGDRGGATAERRRVVSAYRVYEPRHLGSRKVAWTRFRFVYPHGAHETGALVVSPRSGRVLVVTRGGTAGIYRAPRRLSSTRLNHLHRIADAPSDVIGGAVARRTGDVVLAGSDAVFLYRQGLSRQPHSWALSWAERAGAVSFAPSGRSVLLTTISRNTVWRVPLS